MKRKPNFGYTKYYVITENVPQGELPRWNEGMPEIVDEADLEWWKDYVAMNTEEDEPIDFKTEAREMQNRLFNQEMIFGMPYGDDYETIIIDEDCPECGHLLFQYKEQGKF